jgi:hypothetical protein
MKNWTLWIVGGLLIVGAIGGIVGFEMWKYKQSQKPGPLDSFATCIKDSGAIFYGAYWCQHCQNQKKMFGTSARLLPYHECAKGGDLGKRCEEVKIEGYPTWVFADGSRLSGEVPLANLASSTQCSLPQTP